MPKKGTLPEFDRELGPTRSQLQQMHGYTLREIAGHYHVSRDTVANWFRDYGIERQSSWRNRYTAS